MNKAQFKHYSRQYRPNFIGPRTMVPVGILMQNSWVSLDNSKAIYRQWIADSQNFVGVLFRKYGKQSKDEIRKHKAGAFNAHCKAQHFGFSLP